MSTFTYKRRSRAAKGANFNSKSTNSFQMYVMQKKEIDMRLEKTLALKKQHENQKPSFDARNVEKKEIEKSLKQTKNKPQKLIRKRSMKSPRMMEKRKPYITYQLSMM